MGMRKDASEILSCEDLFLLSSLDEGFGLVLLETMAMRLPIAANRVGGVPEIVDDEKTGILVAPENSLKMANAILKIFRKGKWGGRI